MIIRFSQLQKLLVMKIIKFYWTITKDQRLVSAAGVIVLIVFLLAPYFYNPFEMNFSSCYLKEITGYSCPTCGFSRSFYSFAHLQFADAFKYHPFAMLIYFSILIYILIISIELVTNKKLIIIIPKISSKFIVFAFLIAWIIFFLLRLIIEIVSR